MMRSMYAGVAGLKTHQTRMDVIGNNIANVNTVAYKSQSMTFAELMYQTTQRASGPNAQTGTGGVNARQIGLGVKTSAINTNISGQGATQTTNNPFDIMITGDAFFIVNNGQENFFTRDGSFYVDAVGNLAMTSNGYNVMGWQVDKETMTIRQDTVSPLRIMSPENMTNPPEATTLGYMSGILDKNDTNVTSTAGKNLNLQFYDSLGYSYTARLNLKSTDTEGEYGLELGAVLDENNEPIDISKVQFGNGNPVVVDRQGQIEIRKGVKFNGTEITYDGDANKKVSISAKDLGITVDGNNYTIMSEKDLEEAVAKGAANGGMDQATMDNILATREALCDAYGVDSIEALHDLIINKKTDGTDAAADQVASVLQVLLDGAKRTALGINVDAKTGSYDVIDFQQESIDGFLVTYDPTTGVFDNVGGGDTFTINMSNITIPQQNGTESKFEDIVVDMTATTMYNNSGSSTIGATSGNPQGLGTGRKIGEMIGVSIQTDGMIYATYDNGQTQLLGQIAVAEFANASGLEKQGDNLYSATLNSGEFDGIGVNITANGGYMNTGVLEMSNVDLSAEFTEMITTQRGFQANSRIITVSDTMLEELVNLKR